MEVCMSDNLVILIHGKAFAGKDSVYNTLRVMTAKDADIQTYDNYQAFVNSIYAESLPEFLAPRVEHCLRVPFADEVKKELCRMNPSVDYQRLMTDPVYKSNYRKELVEIGDGYRKSNPNIWVEKHRESFFPLLEKVSKKIIFITDVRYINEFDYGEEIERETNNIVIRLKVESPLPHRLSRMSYDAAKKYIQYSKYNNGENMEELAMKACRNIKWDLEIQNYNITKTYAPMPFVNPLFEIPRCFGNMAYKGKYLEIYQVLSRQLQSIADIYNNMKEA